MNQFYEKYGLITHGISRTYKVPTLDRVYGFERATVSYIKIEDFKLKDCSWKKAIFEVGKYLQVKHKLPVEELYSFSVDWTTGLIYQDHKFQINCEQIAPDIWFNIGYASTHGIWLIQELIKLYKINPDDCEIIVHLPSMSEPEEVIKYYKELLLSNFKSYLLDEHLSEDTCGSVIRGIQTLNKVLVKLNCGANDFFLMDDRQTLSLYKSKVLAYCRDYGIFKGKQLDLAKRFLDYYSNFLREFEIETLMKEGK